MTAIPPSPDLALSDTDDQPASIPKTSAASQAHDGRATDSHFGHLASTEAMSGRDGSMDPRSKLSSLLKGREQEWTAVVSKKGPLRLLDLPLDVLKEIVKEVTHTNDLTALALTHSALHALAIPHIYSRFDIVWPDAHSTTESRTGVDALTYGLATLCMGDVLANTFLDRSYSCTSCGAPNKIPCDHGPKSEHRPGQRRLGNQYPQFTRKFSLGNGPADWVQEYLITKESGKMLGTLVALAVARMRNLETFVWDMPTGVLRDVWLALSSLQNRESLGSCRLERVWVRWHDNCPNDAVTQASLANTATIESTMSSIGWTVPANSNRLSRHPISYTQSTCEWPTLSVLPSLSSLSVLDIDEPDYLDEMSVVIAKSRDRLRELRVGIAPKAVNKDFALAWDGPDLHQVDFEASWPGASTIGSKRLGGVLGVLLGRVYDIRKKQKGRTAKQESSQADIQAQTNAVSLQLVSNITVPMDIHSGQAFQEFLSAPSEITPLDDTWSAKQGSTASEGVILNPGVDFALDGEASMNAAESLPEEAAIPAGHSSVAIDTEPPLHNAGNVDGPQTLPVELTPKASKAQNQSSSLSLNAKATGRERLEGKLRLHTLELERVSLSIAVLQKGFDWSTLTSLTLLDCPQHDKLWVMLRRHFEPTPVGTSRHSATSSVQYHLNLKKIHTDTASSALISFLKETLAPNTLEVLFLQDRRRSLATAGPRVTIESIYRGPLKRHRASLKKLMLDSSDGIPISVTNPSDENKWRDWIPHRDVLNFITSGRMSSLRELSIGIEYKDWHHVLQRLPQIPHLRSLNIPFIADHVTPAFDPKELALQVVDVIVLRPEVELCYMGISHKCFEILENRPHDEANGSGDAHPGLANGPLQGSLTDEEDGSDDEVSDEEDVEEEEEEEEVTNGSDDDEEDAEADDGPDDSDSDSGEDDRSRVRLRLREILFYDDKVAIFKARHGKL